MGYVYIVANKHLTVLYIGVTNDIERRICEHKAGIGSTFTSKFKCNILLFHEQYFSMGEAIEREKQMKKWKRDWKIELIKQENPEMLDLAIDWYNEDQLNLTREEYKKRKQET